MNISIVDVQGFPAQAHLSIRVGNERRQSQVKIGSEFNFALTSLPRSFAVDVFERIASSRIESHDIDGVQQLEFLHPSGSSMKLGMRIATKDQDVCAAGRSGKGQKRTQAASKAKNYLESKAVPEMLQGMVHHLLSAQPEDAVVFLMDYLSNWRRQSSETSTSATDSPCKLQAEVTPMRPRCETFGTFPADGSLKLPLNNTSIAATVIQEDLSVYEHLKALRTPLDVSLAACLNAGVDSSSQGLTKTIGLVAGDEFCYDVFKEVFEPVVSCLHHGYTPESIHPVDLDPSKLDDMPNAHVVSIELRGSRNIAGLRMLPCISCDERREVERALTRAFFQLPANLQGEYYPLRGSETYLPRRGGMDSGMANILQTQRLLFEEPMSAELRASGFGLNWPHARGVFRSSDGSTAAWINEREHLQIFARQRGGDFKAAFSRFLDMSQALQASLQDLGYDYASSSHLGFLTACSSSLGTGLHISVVLCLPHLGAQLDLVETCKELGLSARMTSQEKHWEVASSGCLGNSYVHQINIMICRCLQLLNWERRMELGELDDRPF